jgi:hypothetical protein
MQTSSLPWVKAERWIIIPSDACNDESTRKAEIRICADLCVALATIYALCDFFVHRFAEMFNSPERHILNEPVKKARPNPAEFTVQNSALGRQHEADR